MHAKKIQTTFGRKIVEKGFIPERGHLGSFPLYFRRETSTTGKTWMRLRKEGETPLDDHAAVPSTWLGFEYANELMVIYIPEN